MKNNTTIRIKNELPELLEAVCNHKDCPYWLRIAIRDAVDDQTQYVMFTALSFRASFEAMNRELSPDAADVLEAEVLR